MKGIPWDSPFSSKLIASIPLLTEINLFWSLKAASLAAADAPARNSEPLNIFSISLCDSKNCGRLKRNSNVTWLKDALRLGRNGKTDFIPFASGTGWYKAMGWNGRTPELVQGVLPLSV